MLNLKTIPFPKHIKQFRQIIFLKLCKKSEIYVNFISIFNKKFLISLFCPENRLFVKKIVVIDKILHFCTNEELNIVTSCNSHVKGHNFIKIMKHVYIA